METEFTIPDLTSGHIDPRQSQSFTVPETTTQKSGPRGDLHAEPISVSTPIAQTQRSPFTRLPLTQRLAPHTTIQGNTSGGDPVRSVPLKQGISRAQSKEFVSLPASRVAPQFAGKTLLLPKGKSVISSSSVPLPPTGSAGYIPQDKIPGAVVIPTPELSTRKETVHRGEATQELPSNAIALIEKQYGGLLFSALLCAVIGVFVMPPVLGVGAIIMAIIALRRGARLHGVGVLLLSICLMLLGIYFGASQVANEVVTEDARIDRAPVRANEVQAHANQGNNQEGYTLPTETASATNTKNETTMPLLQ